jgi:hypothetical protein
MLAAAVLASWVAQAEPAPPESPPAQAAPLVAKPAPSASTPDNTVGIYAGVGHRVGPEAHTFAPTTDVSIGGSYEWRYWSSPGGLELGVGLNFFYDQFSEGMQAPFVSQNSFAATQIFAWRSRWVRPFALLGAGISIGYATDGAGLTAAQPMLRGGAGLEITVARNMAVALRGSYTLLITRPTLTVPATPTSDAITYSPLGNFLDADLGVTFQF